MSLTQLTSLTRQKKKRQQRAAGPQNKKMKRKSLFREFQEIEAMDKNPRDRKKGKPEMHSLFFRNYSFLLEEPSLEKQVKRYGGRKKGGKKNLNLNLLFAGTVLNFSTQARLLANMDNVVYVGSKKGADSVMFLCTLAAGGMCVTSKWIGDCCNAHRLISPAPFLLRAPIPKSRKFFLEGIRVQLNGSIEFKNKW